MDSRDKVYAILDLVQRNKDLNVSMIVDYHKSMPRVFYDAITGSTRSEKSLHFLSYIDHRPQLEKRGSMPS